MLSLIPFFVLKVYTPAFPCCVVEFASSNSPINIYRLYFASELKNIENKRFYSNLSKDEQLLIGRSEFKCLATRWEVLIS